MAGLGEWLDERTGWRAWARARAGEAIPGGARLRYALGAALAYLFMQQVALGILLALYYSPSAAGAWASTAYLNDQVSGGWFIRGLHYHGSSLMVLLCGVHFAQVVIAGAYRRPREVNWWIGLVMAALVLAFTLTGYMLPWDQMAYWGTQVRAGIAGSAPGGETLFQLVQGGREAGNLTLTRTYAIHVFALPLALGGLLAAHVRLARRHGVTPPAGLDEAELARRAQPRWPHQLALDVLVMALCGAGLVAATSMTHGAELYAPADPSSNFVARPEWFFLFLFQLLKYFEGPLQAVATVLLPGAIAVFLAALPFVDRAPTRRARGRAPVLVAVGALMAGVVALTAIAVAEDAGDAEYQEGLAEARAEAAKARALAREGVPPAGGVAVWENDPEFQVRALYKEQCAGCHMLGGKGGEDAPSFDGYGTREWLAALLREPGAKRFYGGTKGHTAMEPLKAEDVPDDELRALVEYVYGLMGPEAGPIDAALAERGKALWDDKLECSGCHEVEAGKESAGPALGGRGTLAWLQRAIADTSAPDLYGEGAEMPKFGAKLSAAEIEALAGLIARQRVEPPVK